MAEDKKKIVIVQKKEGSIGEGHNKKKSIKEDRKSFDTGALNNIDMESFEEMYEKSFTELKNGDIINGKVANIQGNQIFIDVGYKSEGKVDADEFNSPVKVGDEVRVMVITREDAHGNVILSKEKADEVDTKKLIAKNFDEKMPIKGKILKEIKGGYVVGMSGRVEAFLPGSQLDVRRVSNPKEYINKTFDFKIAKYDAEKNNIVLSRREFLEEKIAIEKDKFFNSNKEGDIISGKVKNVLDYGAFVDLGAIDGFIPIKEVSWSHLRNCRDYISEGIELEVKILKIDIDQQKVTLGIKQLSEDPWEVFSREYKNNDVISGEVVKLADYGAFVRVKDGIEGLLHVNELSWTKKISHPKQILKVGEHIQASILDMDKENRKLSLGLKQILDNPWDFVYEKYPEGKKIEGVIRAVTDFGVFIEIDDELTGLLRVKDIDWTKKPITNLKKDKRFKKGQKIDVIILKTDKEKQIISLGLKQLLDNPWEIFKANHPKGSIIKGKINKIVEIGIFIEIENNIDGFLHVSEMLKKRDEAVENIYNIGDVVDCSVIKVDIKKQQISLSKKEYERRIEQMAIEKYSKSSSDSSKVTLGDLIDFDKLKNNPLE